MTGHRIPVIPTIGGESVTTNTLIKSAYGEYLVRNQDLEALMAFAIKQIDRECGLMPQYKDWRTDEPNPELALMAEWRKLALGIADVVE